MQINRCSFIYSICLLFSLTCCRTHDIIPVGEVDASYQPLNLGHFVVYNVDSVRYDDRAVEDLDSVIITASSYQIRETIIDSSVDEMGVNYTLRIEKRRDTSRTFQPIGFATLRRVGNDIERQEADLRWIKLRLPLDLNSTWEGSTYIPNITEYQRFRNWLFQVTAVSATDEQVNSVDRVIITQVDKENVIEKTFAEEHYVKDVGMTYRKFQILGKQRTERSWDEPETGYDVTYTAVAVGKMTDF